MDREKLKSAGKPSRARAARDQREEPGTTATKVSDALGAAPRTITLDGREFTLRALDFNDLVELDALADDVQEFLADLIAGKLRAFRGFAWLMLRKADPALSGEDREELRYRMTLAEAGRLIPVAAGEREELLMTMLATSGLLPNAPSPEETTTPGPPTGSS